MGPYSMVPATYRVEALVDSNRQYPNVQKALAGQGEQRLQRLDEDPVGARVQKLVRAAHRLIQAVDGTRVGARADDRVGVHALRREGLHLGHGLLGGNDILSGHMAAPLRPGLVLDLNGLGADLLVDMQRVDGILDVAVAVVDVDENRQIRHLDDVGHGGGDVGHGAEPEIGDAVACPHGRKPTDKQAGKPRLLGEARAQSVVDTGHEQRLLFSRQNFAEAFRCHSAPP